MNTFLGISMHGIIMAQIHHFEEVTSTNTYAKDHMYQLASGDVIWADHQTNGKGRLGRSWVNPIGNLCMSLVYKNQVGDISLYPLLCAVAVSAVIGRLTGEPAGIKWPNDIIFRQKKLCGILCESTYLASQIHIICGIGINVNTDQSQFGDAAPYATSLKAELGREFDLASLVTDISGEMERVLEEYRLHGFERLKTEYEQRLVNRNREVRVIYQNRTLTGTARGIAPNGNLICDCAGEQVLINSGEASVRGLYGYV